MVKKVCQPAYWRGAILIVASRHLLLPIDEPIYFVLVAHVVSGTRVLARTSSVTALTSHSSPRNNPVVIRNQIDFN